MPLYMTQGLYRTLQSHPDRIATICSDRQHAYRHYADRVARVAGVLQTFGMARGDRIGILALNSDRYLEFYYGTWWGGGAVNPVNFRWSASEIAYSLDDCESKILLVDEQFKAIVTNFPERKEVALSSVPTCLNLPTEMIDQSISAGTRAVQAYPVIGKFAAY